MEVIITVSAAQTKEMKKNALRINQCKSFVKLAFRVDGIESHGVHENNVASFKCASFAIDAEHSSTNWNKFFSYEVDGDLVKVKVIDGYTLGPIIPGYQ